MKKYFGKEIRDAYLLRFCPFIVIVLSNIIFGIYNNQDSLLSIVFNYFPSLIIIYSIFSLLVFITKSLKKSNYIILIFYFLFLIINQIKIFYTKEPIYLSDILLLGSINEIVSITNGTLLDFLKLNIVGIFIQFLVFTMLFLLLKRTNSTKITRKYIMIVPFIILTFLSLPFEMTTNLMKHLFGFDSINDYGYVVSNLQYSTNYGLIGALYGNMLEDRIFEPINYNEEDIKKVLEQESELGEKSNINRPNIIFIFDESFFDITKLGDELVFSEDILKDYHDLSNQFKLIQVLSPSYGGMSSNVEFELFTGSNLAYYSKSYIPYLRLVDKNFGEKDNIVSLLNNVGYKTYIFKSFSDELYNEGNVYKYLGFQNKIEYDSNKQNYKGYYISDKYVVDKAIELINEEEDSIFYFLTTMQNHTPYKKEKYDKYDIDIVKSDLDNEEKNTILSYSQGVYDASCELKRLYDYIKTIKEETIVIFIGDHLPYIKALDKMNYFNTDDGKINYYRKYNTEALIFSNFKINFDDTSYLSPDFLLPYVLNAVNIPMNSQYNYLIEKSKNILPCYNRYVSISKDGKLYYTANLTGEMLKEYQLRESFQYKMYYK